jgi:hypothetical protein
LPNLTLTSNITNNSDSVLNQTNSDLQHLINQSNSTEAQTIKSEEKSHIHTETHNHTLSEEINSHKPTKISDMEHNMTSENSKENEKIEDDEENE